MRKSKVDNVEKVLKTTEEEENIDIDEKFEVHKNLNNIDTITWLRKRAAEIAKIQYLNNASQLEKHQAIVRVFEKFDEDGNGTLEVAELREMFDKNKIDISSEELLTLFSIVDEDKSGALDLNEFKAFALSENANKHFRDIITELRYKDTYKHPEDRAKFLPFNFNTLLNYLSDTAWKDTFREELREHKEKITPVNVKHDIQKFLKLFKNAYNKVIIWTPSQVITFSTYSLM